jgi:hypothetical protein
MEIPAKTLKDVAELLKDVKSQIATLKYPSSSLLPKTPAETYNPGELNHLLRLEEHLEKKLIGL